jgi:hypothetical protein
MADIKLCNRWHENRLQYNVPCYAQHFIASQIVAESTEVSYSRQYVNKAPTYLGFTRVRYINWTETDLIAVMCNSPRSLFELYEIVYVLHWSQTLTPAISTCKDKQEVLGRTNRPLVLMRHGPHRKRRVQQFFNCCVCICCRGNVFIDPFPSIERGIHYRHGLMEETYKVRHWDGLRWHNIHIKFHKDWLGDSKADRGDTQTHGQHGDRILVSLLLFFQNKKNRTMKRKLNIHVCNIHTH